MNELDSKTKILFEEKQAELIKIIDVLAKLDGSKEWETLKESIFKKSLEGIERQIMNEALAAKIDSDKIYRLQGELAWARQYNDIGKLGESLKKQLEEIKRKLKNE